MDKNSFLWPISLTAPLLKVTVDGKMLTVQTEVLFEQTGQTRLTLSAAALNPEIPYDICYSGNFTLIRQAETKKYFFKKVKKMIYLYFLLEGSYTVTGHPETAHLIFYVASCHRVNIF